MRRGKKKRHPNLPPTLGTRPIVAILGRPNVGKSTLFNRLARTSAAIVEDKPGVTRDRLYADTDIDDRDVVLIDMGGFEATPEDVMAAGINRQCLAGLEQADVVLFVIDGRVPPTQGDLDTVKILRRSNKPAVLVVNKVDSPRLELDAQEAYSLGMDKLVMISALHGRGITELEDEVLLLLPERTDAPPEPEEYDEGLCKVAIIGRPNAGKSSLVNRLLGEDRLLTMDMPGTTRDPVDSYFERGDKRYVLVDTAGIRRKRAIDPEGAERMAVGAAMKAMERCHVTILLVDGHEGITEQDAKVLGLATERGRAVVLGLNKWDLVKKEDPDFREHMLQRSKDILSFTKWLKVVKLSAVTGNGLDKLINHVDSAFAEFGKRVKTSEVNRLLEDIIDHHPPPMHKGKIVKLYYATQASVRPPTFVFQTNHPDAIHFSYKRYVENRLREVFGFEGTPIRLFFRQRKRNS